MATRTSTPPINQGSALVTSVAVCAVRAPWVRTVRAVFMADYFPLPRPLRNKTHPKIKTTTAPIPQGNHFIQEGEGLTPGEAEGCAVEPGTGFPFTIA